MAQTNEAPLRSLLLYSRKHKKKIYLASLFSVANKVFDLAPPGLIGASVDVVVNKEHSFLATLGVKGLSTQLYLLAGITVLIWVLESVFEFLFKIYWRNLAQEVQHELRMDCYNHLQTLDMSLFESESPGHFMAIINDDINQLERFVNTGANELIQVGTTVVVIGGIYLYFSPILALLSFLPIPLILICSFYFQKKILSRYSNVRERVSILNAHLSSNIGGIGTIKSFATEKFESSVIDEKSRDYAEANRSAIFLSSLFGPLIRMAVLMGFTFTLLWGGQLTLDGKLGVGVYSVLIFLTQRLLWPLTRLGEVFDLYQRAMASVLRTHSLLAIQPSIQSGEKNLLGKIKGEIEFRQVSFSYPERDEVLHNLSFSVPAGKTYGLVGQTGAGKSTLFKLILRFYDVTKGAILLDGEDIRQITLASLRGNIGYVSQDVFLFPGTVWENIAYGSPQASEKEIKEAARLSESLEFIEKLPQKYNTLIGERGQKLSGGQRQRISIARAILRNPPILLLDEATSSVDNETEALIQKAMNFISQNRTTLVIAHRLSTVRKADQILVLSQGEIVERGTHEELIAMGKIYSDLWTSQEVEA